MKKLEMSKILIRLKNIFYVEKEIKNIMINLSRNNQKNNFNHIK